jgi:hypothetical protein
MLNIILLPISFPFSMDMNVLIGFLKNMFFVSPVSLICVSIFFLLWMSLKTLTAKLLFLSSGFLFSSVFSYFIYKKEQKKIKKIEKKRLDFSSHTLEGDNESEEKELILSKMFQNK